MLHFKVSSVIPLIIFILFGITLFFILPNGYQGVRCRLGGGTLIREGWGWHCLMTYEDGNKKCYTNADCKSKKCTLSNNWNGEKRYYNFLAPSGEKLDESVEGLCSENNRLDCFTGETTITESRRVIFPSICD